MVIQWVLKGIVVYANNFFGMQNHQIDLSYEELILMDILDIQSHYKYIV